MVAWVHPGLPPIGKSEDRGAVRVRSREVFRGSKKQRAAAHPGTTPRSLANRLLVVLATCKNCCAAPNTFSLLPCWLGSIRQIRHEPEGSPLSKGRAVFSGRPELKSAAHRLDYSFPHPCFWSAAPSPRLQDREPHQSADLPASVSMRGLPHRASPSRMRIRAMSSRLASVAAVASVIAGLRALEFRRDKASDLG
jgi:hypothetical protein